MDLANTFREERKSAELQHLDKDFYQQVGVYLVGLGQELSRVEDPFGVEAQILQDTLKSEKNSVSKLIDQTGEKDRPSGATQCSLCFPGRGLPWND